ncbi:hypothetical protein HDR58_01210 [bacterium]|nr:hypothetical protein [bacterium]
MSFFSKVSAKISNDAVKLPNRFTENGFMPMGAVKRTPRTNTTEELVSSIRAYAKESPEIAEFAKHLDEMNPEHLRLAQDVIDLSRTQEMLTTNINLNNKNKDGEKIIGRILRMLPEVSKKNPGAIELTESVINNSDTTNAKYFLASLFNNDLAKFGELSEHMKALKSLVPQIAEETLSGGYMMDYSKEQNFYRFVTNFCRNDANPESIGLLPKVLDIVDTICKKIKVEINGTTIALGNPKTITENMEILPQLLKNAEAKGQDINVSEFLTNNVNLK